MEKVVKYSWLLCGLGTLKADSPKKVKSVKYIQEDPQTHESASLQCNKLHGGWSQYQYSEQDLIYDRHKSSARAVLILTLQDSPVLADLSEK